MTPPGNFFISRVVRNILQLVTLRGTSRLSNINATKSKTAVGCETGFVNYTQQVYARIQNSCEDIITGAHVRRDATNHTSSKSQEPVRDGMRPIKGARA